ncbi:cytochrome P450 [Oryctes borbonicus]|uniref:Cytochrome P450 n=1 Tax=Oryctes borbonicus TaxID=1629725 RepID=A0A0T6BAY5_9SCAR|nr:cytochrome P450 [Oryctes borbonicus]
MKRDERFRENTNSSYLKARVDYFTILGERMYSLLLANQFFFRISSSFNVMQKALDIIKQYTLSIIKAKEGKAENDSKVANHLIDILIANDVRGEMLNHQINTFILAGHDTTAQSMCFTMYELSKNPQLQQRLFEEIISVIGKDPNTEITSADLQEMKYLEAVVKESLRLHSIVPIIERKISHSIEFNGVTYPKDTTFMFHIGGIHTSEDHFPNPEKFDPDRFMPENSHTIQKNAFMPFAIGPRDCIGKFFAMLEVKYFIAQCIQKFELMPVENHIAQELNEIIIKSLTGLPVVLKERAKM